MEIIYTKKFLKSQRNHRKENYWDVTYDKNIDLSKFTNSVISDFDDKNSYNRKIINNENIYLSIKDKNNGSIDKSLNIKLIDFEQCDFSGNNNSKKITFENCNFHKCYFSFSTFNSVNFNNCRFESCSFSQSKFIKCIFDSNCSFFRLSISGSKTEFIDTEIQASKFFNKIYKPFKEGMKNYKHKNVIYEEYRLNKSIVKLSRTILESTKTCADDDFFYDAVKNICLNKIKEKQSNNLKKIEDIKKNLISNKTEITSRENKQKKRLIKNIFKFSWLQIKRPTYLFEMFMMKVFGLMNKWGGSLSRVFFCGGLILLLYTIIYMIMDGNSVSINSNNVIASTHVKYYYYLTSSLIKSFDITFLAGYTKHITMYDSISKQLIMLSNMLIGLFWYVVLIPTLINKISITRL